MAYNPPSKVTITMVCHGYSSAWGSLLLRPRAIPGISPLIKVQHSTRGQAEAIPATQTRPWMSRWRSLASGIPTLSLHMSRFPWGWPHWDKEVGAKPTNCRVAVREDMRNVFGTRCWHHPMWKHRQVPKTVSSTATTTWLGIFALVVIGHHTPAMIYCYCCPQCPQSYHKNRYHQAG